MTLTVIFNNHRLAVDACNALGGVGCCVIPGPKRKMGQEELIVDFPPATPKKTRRLERIASGIVQDYSGKIVL